ncbi:MAG: hypothetical protein ACTSUP_09955 [Candidatus Heimdallarchaeaceae archaeon]
MEKKRKNPIENGETSEKLPAKAERRDFVSQQLLKNSELYEETCFAQPNKFKSNVEKNVPVIVAFIIVRRPELSR